VDCDGSLGSFFIIFTIFARVAHDKSRPSA